MRNLIKIWFQINSLKYLSKKKRFGTNISEFRSSRLRSSYRWSFPIEIINRDNGSRHPDGRRRVPYFRQWSSSAPHFHQYARKAQRWVPPVVTKQHRNFDNRITYRRWSRVNTVRFPKPAPKAQGSRGSKGMLPLESFWILTPLSRLSWVSEAYR